MAKAESHDKPCPKCGHCPTCGRSNTSPNYWPWYRWYPPVYPTSTYTGGGTKQISTTNWANSAN